MEINVTVAMFLPQTISSISQNKRTLAKHFSIGSNDASSKAAAATISL